MPRIWVLEGDVGHMTRAVLMNSETERPLDLEAFSDEEEARLFVLYAEHTHADLLKMLPAELRDLQDEWNAHPKETPARPRTL